MIDFTKKEIIGMIHLSGPDTVAKAMEEIRIYEEEGLSGIIVENYHGGLLDVIDTLDALEATPTTMSVGINILPNEWKKSFELADRYQFISFMQLDYVSGEYVNAPKFDTENFIAYRAVSEVKVFGGVWPKYYRPVAGSILDIDIFAASNFIDGIVVTGEGTGMETPLEKIKMFRDILFEQPYPEATPLIIGAGLTPLNVREQLAFADGAIVGSAFKPNGRTQQMVDRDLVKCFMDEVKKI